MACEHCTPDKNGNRKPLYVQKFYIPHHSMDKYKRNVLKIYRQRNNKKKYFMAVHSMDLSDKGTIFRNNGFIMKKYISYCPVCGEELKSKTKGLSNETSAC